MTDHVPASLYFSGITYTLGHRHILDNISGCVSEIKFYISGGAHDTCTNGASLALGGGSGRATAPAG